MRNITILITIVIGLVVPQILAAQSNQGTDRGLDKPPRQLKKGVPQDQAGDRGRRSARRTNARPAGFFRKLDRNEDGSLTIDEIPQRLRQRLGRLDSDGNGIVSRKEFAAATKGSGRGQPDRNKPKQARNMAMNLSPGALLDRLDRNDDDRLSENEVPARMRKKCAEIDSSGDGFVDAAEMATLMERIKARDSKGRYQSDPEKTRNQMPKRPPRRVKTDAKETA